MATTTVDIGTLIVSTPGWCGGRPRIAGTSIAVASVATITAAGHSPQEIVSEFYPHLTLAQVHAALAYYLSNQDAIDQRTAEDEALFERLERAAREGR